MTSIERTAYPRFSRAPSVKELREIYTPTPTDVAFVVTTARGPAQKFGLMILLKVYQRLGYFPKPETIPGAIIGLLGPLMKSTTRSSQSPSQASSEEGCIFSLLLQTVPE